MRRVMMMMLVCVAVACMVSAARAGGNGPAPDACCRPWDNGRYDERGAQMSQTGFDQDWRQFGRISFDDFWLCEGSIYRIRGVRGTLCTDALLPKAQIIIVRDCDGRPDLSRGGLVAIADSVPPDLSDAPVGADCRVGTLTITETGRVNADGFRILEVEASFPKLWLRGGSYWVAVIGYSGNANPLDQFFWAYAGNGVVKGRPGVFFDSTDETITDVDELCCGCTDFAFCVQGEECKILLDNGGPDFTRLGPSLANPGSIFRESRAADDVVVPKCQDRAVCYVEGYLLTNCDPPRARLDIYDNQCKLPATFSRPITFSSQCIEDLGVTIDVEGLSMKAYRVAFWDLRTSDGEPFVLQRDKNYWFSIYAVGGGAQNHRGYFVGADRCDVRCNGRTLRFNPAAVSGRGVGRTDSSWISVETYSGTAFDLSLMVATDDRLQRRTVAAVNPCVADRDNNGSVGLQDLFDFLAAWFAGCP